MTNDPTLPAGASVEPSNGNAVIPRFSLASEGPAEGRLAELRALFPEAVHDGRFDVDQVRREVGDWGEDGPERFGLTWPGKAECMRVIQQPSIGTLRPVREESVDFDTTQNAIIEGDNLEVLKLLQKGYYAKVKLIYIDPPYNTGGDFIYPDNFREGLQGYLRYSGQVDDSGLRLSANTESDGRYHSKWLSMMYPRLFLARNLLRDDGLIFVSVDDHEVCNLRAVMNDVFGEENFVAQLVWQNKTGAGARTTGFIVLHEYVLCFSKQRDSAWDVTATMSEKTRAMYTKKDEHYERLGPYATWPLDTTSMDDRPNLRFPIMHDGHEIWPKKQWLWSRDKVGEAQAANGLVFNFNAAKGSWSVRFKGYLNSNDGAEREGKPTTLIQGVYTQEGTKDFQKTFERDVFPFPKPVGLIKRLLATRVATSNTSTDPDIVLDFFAGSGTTAEAVLELNRDDGGNRLFILVQLPEPTGRQDFKTISDITRERVRRVIGRLNDAKERELAVAIEGSTATDHGFRAYKLAESNFAVWDSANSDVAEVQSRLILLSDNVTAAQSQEGMLTELLMKAGYPLIAEVEELTLVGKRVFAVEDSSLLICLEPSLTIEVFEAMAALEPSLVLVLDAGFGNDDQLKVNALQTIRSRATSQAPTELKVI
jgi:adenine-specific DNA-methyltransferase